MARERVYASAAERQAAYRARKAGGDGGRTLSVVLPADLAEALDAYMVRQASDGAGLDRSAVICKLLRTQLLRKR